MVRDEVQEALGRAYPSYLSGEALSRTLGVSRSAVWKAVRSLDDPVESVPGRGYRLKNPPTRLSGRAIEALLEGDFYRVTALETVDSTISYLKARAAEGESEGAVVVTERQSAGRGRLGRSFFSPPGTGLYMGILLRPDIPATEAMNLTTAAAVAVCQAIEAVSGREARIKWVNDVLVNGLKVCGILTEAQVSVEDGSLKWAVVGIGINVREPDGGFPSELAGVAGTVFGRECAPDARTRLAAAVLKYFDIARRSSHLAAYRKRLLTIGQEIDVIVGSRTRRAFATGLDDEFRLLVRYEDGETQALSSGEVSTRLNRRNI